MGDATTSTQGMDKWALRFSKSAMSAKDLNSNATVPRTVMRHRLVGLIAVRTPAILHLQ